MVTKRRFYLFTLVAFIASVFVQYTPVSAVYDASGDRLQAARGNNEEYYYYDDDKVVGDGGEYASAVTFKELYPNIYTTEGTSFKASNTDKALVQGCTDVPTKLWDEDEAKSGKEPAFYLNILDEGSVELDWKNDKEDGISRWGEITGKTGLLVNASESDLYKDHPFATGKTISGGTVSTDESVAHSPLYLQETDTKCHYRFYDYFHRLIAPYDDNTLNPGSLKGKILGIKGMKFTDYTKRADNRLKYKAYRRSARENIIDNCNRKLEVYKCINETDKQFHICYGDAIGSHTLDKMTTSTVQEKGHPKEADITAAREQGVSAIFDLKDEVWTKDFDQDKFVSCLAGKEELVSAGYFKSKDQLEEFAKTIIDDVILPVSLSPRDPDKVKDTTEIDSETRCSIGMMGWILCPVFSFMSQITDKVFDILKNWLVLAPFQQGVGVSNAAAYDVWSKLRNIANVLFVVFFMFIIYAQITGRGVSVYGFRALLPRVIIGALLVNLSYIICGVAVDLSNMLGDSLFSLLNNVKVSGAKTQFGTWEDVTSTVVLAGGAAAGTVALLANLAAFVPILIMSFIALVTTFLVLLFRQALIIILIIASPIAFALFVLPSTSGWFNKWKSTFITLLMLYPAFSLVFGGSQIAAEIVRDSAAENGETILTIFSLGIQVIPLFLVPLVMKLGGGILNRFGGMINNKDKGPFDRMRKYGDEFRNDRKVQQETRAMNGRFGVMGYGGLIRRQQRQKAKHQYHATNTRRASSDLAAGDPAGVAKGAAGLLGSSLDKQIRDYLGEETSKRKLEDFNASVALIEHTEEPVSVDELKDMAFKRGNHANIDETSQAAAMKKLVDNGDVADIDALLAMANKESGQMTDFQREMLVHSIKSSGIAGQAAHLNSANLDSVRSGSIAAGQSGVDSLYANAVANGLYTANTLASQKGSALSHGSEDNPGGLRGAIRRGAIDEGTAKQLRKTFATATNDAKLRGGMNDSTYQAGRKL